MAFIYPYRCDCGEETEDNNPSPPRCPKCGKLMKRVYTPPDIFVRGGTPKSHSVNDISAKQEQQKGIAEYEAEQNKLKAGMRKRMENDDKAFKRYCEGELHHKHGRPDEAATYDPKAKYKDVI